MKKAIRKLLNYVGYDIVKVVPTPFMAKEVPVKVGSFTLTFPTNNPLIKTYNEQPDFATEIGRLVKYTLTKYPKLIFIDVGANAGDTIATVKSVSDVPVIAVEGDNFSYSYLKKNTAAFQNVTLYNTFLGEKAGKLSVALEKQGWNTTIIPDATTQNVIDLKTLDEVIAAHSEDMSRMKVLKIDTEGFDTKIIRGAENFIRSIKPVIYFEYNRDNMSAIGEDGLAALKQLAGWGYDQVLFYDDRGRFVVGTDITNERVIKNLHDYADGRRGLIYYYNVCLFATHDRDLAMKTITAESEL